MALKLPAFEPNDYRKRVLAAVEARGGPQASDPFELYDLPVDGTERVSDGAVADRVAEVWAFWQRQRDHPKYRALVAALVAAHDANAAGLLDSRSRAALAARVRQDRAGRDAARFALFDGAVAALIARHGGIPRDKLTRLEDVGRDSGLTPDEVAGRVRMHHIVDPAPTPTVVPVPTGGLVPEHRRQQVRALLDELGRIWECPPPATLLALLDCEADADDRQVAMSAAALRARARELPSDRVRTVVDELLVHIGDLLESGPAMRGAYLDGVAAEVAEKLRPRVRAAVLVEDRLTVDDQAHLVAEAADLGLDAARAGRVLAVLAAELGAPVDDMPGRPTHPPASASPTPAPGGARAWEAPLRAARAALRGGRPVEAGRLAEDARRAALPERQPSITAVADEIDTVLTEARLQWRAASSALEARRFAEAADHLEHLARVAADLPDPTGTVDAGVALAQARAAVTEADRLVVAALAGPESVRSAGLLAALAACTGHPGAMAELAAIPLAGPVRVRAERVGTNDVTVSWEPVAATGAMYKVTRLTGDGSWRTVGRTAAASITDGGAPDGPTPVYGVATVQAGRSSEPTRSDATGLPTPQEVRARRAADGTVIVTWAGQPAEPGAVADVEYQVARLTPDGTWRILGRTRARTLEDGGAPAGPLPVYGVAARLGPASSERATSDPA